VLRVKVHAVALNPTDHKHIDTMPDLAGCLVGMDFAGVVETIADGDPTRQFKLATGSRRLFMDVSATSLSIPSTALPWHPSVDLELTHSSKANLMQKEDGAFAEYV
jgi:NADPH:quinone reductase-like Zn-dependent oxidoreductase